MQNNNGKGDAHFRIVTGTKKQMVFVVEEKGSKNQATACHVPVWKAPATASLTVMRAPKSGLAISVTTSQAVFSPDTA